MNRIRGFVWILPAIMVVAALHDASAESKRHLIYDESERHHPDESSADMTILTPFEFSDLDADLIPDLSDIDFHTGQELNGWGWLSMSTDQQHSFIKGYVEGLLFLSKFEISERYDGTCHDIVDIVQNKGQDVLINASYNDVVQFINRYYDEVSSRGIPVREVYYAMYIETSGGFDESDGTYSEALARQKAGQYKEYLLRKYSR